MPKKQDYDVPDPDDDESMEDFIDRCTTEVLDDNPDADEDDVVEACQIAWEERSAHSHHVRNGAKLRHKTHAEIVQGMEFVLSDETPDRMGDIIMSTGWQLDNFNKNPIALFNHRSDFPIGKWHNLRVEGGQLRGFLELAPEGKSPRIDEIRMLIDAGILRAVSVGFAAVEHEPLDKKNPFSGLRFLQQELVETSLVSVPANPNALAVAKSLNISRDTLELVFAKHGYQGGSRRRGPTGKHADTSRRGKGSAMTLAQRIIELQNQITAKAEELDAHLEKMDDNNVSDADLEKTTLLNQQLAQLRKQHASLVESEKQLGTTSTDNNDAADQRRRALVTTTANQDRSERSLPRNNGPIFVSRKKKEIEPLEYLVRAAVCVAATKVWGVLPDVARQRIYGDDEATKVVHEWTIRAPSAPAMTTVTGWAQELVQQIYTDMMALLMPKSVFPRFSAKGLSLNFGRAGKIVLPSRSRTPTIAGSFVGEGMAIPVRQGAFTSQTFTPKKMAVITTWTKEMDDHSIPAIEGVLREAIQEDTAVAIDTVLLDSNAATVIRPAGILNGIAAIGATAGGGMAALVGDIKNLIGALTASTYGNIRMPVWLMNPTDVLSASLVNTANTGVFPFKDEVGRGTLNNIPFIDSATVTAKTMILADAADFVTMGGDNIRFEISDQATLHMEDTTPLDLVSGSPGVVASPQRSLFQTDSIALRMVFPLNWAIRRGGTLAWTQSVTW